MAQLEDYKRELVLIFFAQIRTILGVTALIFAFALLIAYFWPATYAADGKILVRGTSLEKPLDALEDTGEEIFPLKKEDLYSEAHFFESRNVIEAAIRYLAEHGLYYRERELDPGFITREVYRIERQTDITVEPSSNVLKITYHDPDPEQAVIMLTALMEQYLLERQRIYAPDESERFFAAQARKFKNSLEAREGELIALVEKTRVSDPRKEMDNNLLIQNDLERQRNMLATEAIAKDFYIVRLDETLASEEVQFFSFIDNLLLNQLSGKLLDLLAEKGLASRTFHPSSEKIKAIDRQIAVAYTALKAEVKAIRENEVNQLLIINRKISDIETRLQEIKNRNVDLQQSLIAADRISRETDFLLSTYNTLARRREEAKIDTTMDKTNLSAYVKIISKAFAVDGPVFPRKGTVIPLGLLVGFITGCSLGFLREYFDQTIKKPEDITELTELPTIFSIPQWQGGK